MCKQGHVFSDPQDVKQILESLPTPAEKSDESPQNARDESKPESPPLAEDTNAVSGVGKDKEPKEALANETSQQAIANESHEEVKILPVQIDNQPEIDARRRDRAEETELTARGTNNRERSVKRKLKFSTDNTTKYIRVKNLPWN